MSGRFEGLCALVTGAAGGFGRAVAAMLAAEGAKLLLSDLSEEAMAGAGLPDGALRIAGDVSDPAIHRRLVAAARDAAAMQEGR